MMNIVYKFKSKVTKKYYIGSKQECDVINGKILDNKTGKYYYSSAKAEAFWKELEEGNLVLEVLEANIKRCDLLEREAYWQELLDYKSDKCWNQVLATQLHPSVHKDKLQAVCNRFGETLNTLTVNNSTIARLDASAQKEGFCNDGEKTYYYLLEYEEYGTYKKLDEKFNRVSYFKRYLKGKTLSDLDTQFDLQKLKNLLRDGASFIKACEILGVKHWVVRYKVGDSYENLTDKEDLVAEVNGFTSREDFNKQVLILFLEGKTRTEIADSYKNLSLSTVGRIIDKEIRERLDINAIK